MDFATSLMDFPAAFPLEVSYLAKPADQRLHLHGKLLPSLAVLGEEDLAEGPTTQALAQEELLVLTPSFLEGGTGLVVLPCSKSLSKWLS